MSTKATILVVDDDALHLTLYSWILQRQGYQCLTAVVDSNSVELPSSAPVHLVLLDYRLNSSLIAPDVARLIRDRFDSVPIVVLSELQWMPDDMKEHAATFVSKGDPAVLLEAVAAFVPKQ